MLLRISRSHFHLTIPGFLAIFLCVLAVVPFSGALGKNRQPAGGESSTRQSIVSLTSSPLKSPFPSFQNKRSKNEIWQVIEKTSIASRAERKITSQAYQTLHLNKEALHWVLRNAPLESTNAARKTDTVLPLPLPDGRIGKFRIEESPIMAPELAAKFSEIKTYRGQGIDDPSATTRFDITPMGFHAQVLSAGETVYVDPYGKGDTENYISYFKRDLRKDHPFECLVGANPKTGAGSKIEDAQMTVPQIVSPNGATLLTYRLALAATGEYTIAAGGTVPLAMARMTTSLNRVNGIYERELALRMTLVANNDMLIYTDPSTDPYTNDTPADMMSENHDNLNAVIGTTNYDIGHVFGTGPGGTAAVRSTCNTDFKGWGVTGLPSPVGDSFDVDFVAHEMGHQHGGLHTFNTTSGSCSGFRNMISAFEPGSGSTPMSYVGTCAPSNLQSNAHDYFHVRSLEEMVAHMTGAGNCASQSVTGNTPPTVNAGANFDIPRNTPFALTASGSDPDGNPVTYAWEEYDKGSVSPPEGDGDGMARPIFRSYPPTATPIRTFPSLQYILNNGNVPPATYDCGLPAPCISGESLPNITRTMNFQVTARDNRNNGGGIVSAAMQVSVNAGAGPFDVTQPNTAVSWIGNTQETVLWDVAGTTAAPINAATVNILLSTDGGNTFPTVLAALTPNDGTEAITVPNLTTTTARIKVEAVGNIFFDISGANFSIAGSGPTPTPGQVLISEFRFHGSAGSADEFVELYNNTDASVDISGCTLFALTSGGAQTLTFTVPGSLGSNTTTIPAHGHYLIANNSPGGYSLTAVAAPDGTFATDTPDGSGIGLFAGATPTAGNRLDSVGFDTRDPLFFEGATLTPVGGIAADGEYSFVRKIQLVNGRPQDTNNNAADFNFVATTAGVFSGRSSGLGAPGPENLSNPIQRNATIKAFLIDNGCAGSSSGAGAAADTTCARHRDTTSDPSNNSTLGTLSIRRSFKNNTGNPVTQLRFRVVDITTSPAPAGIADLRARTSNGYSAMCVGTGAGCSAPGTIITINGTTLEQPPTQALGGGFNSSLSAGTITLGSPLAPGAVINVQFLLGVEQGGSFRFFVNVEALP